MIRTAALWSLTLLQVVAGARVLWRLIRTAGGERITTRNEPLPGERVTVIVPVLNERHRLGPCLARLAAQPAEVLEILVVDGGSTDGTPALVAEFTAHDRRIRLLDAAPPPPARNGKAHGLQVGLDQAHPATGWVLTVDADVKLAPAAVRSLLAHARSTGAAATSVATAQHLSGAAEGLVHPAMLTTLVYRFGIPGTTARRVEEVQANGQCCLYRREPLARIGGFILGLGSVCEDVTVARALVANGDQVGFHETDGLVEAAMYASWHEAWDNWTRSLPMRDRYAGAWSWLGLAEVVVAQALPPALLLLGRRLTPAPLPLLTVNGALLAARLGVLAGTARAYPRRPWTYWLSPLLDLPVAIRLWQRALQRRHLWRGRLLIRDDTKDRS